LRFVRRPAGLPICEEGDLNPPVPVKNLTILAAKRAKTGKSGQEVDPGGPRLAGRDPEGDKANVRQPSALLPP
jgi:hypothetical protein